MYYERVSQPFERDEFFSWRSQSRLFIRGCYQSGSFNWTYSESVLFGIFCIWKVSIWSGQFARKKSSPFSTSRTSNEKKIKNKIHIKLNSNDFEVWRTFGSKNLIRQSVRRRPLNEIRPGLSNYYRYKCSKIFDLHRPFMVIKNERRIIIIFEF